MTRILLLMNTDSFPYSVILITPAYKSRFISKFGMKNKSVFISGEIRVIRVF